MCLLALGIGSTYRNEVKDIVTYYNKSGKQVFNLTIIAARQDTASPMASDICSQCRDSFWLTRGDSSTY